MYLKKNDNLNIQDIDEKLIIKSIDLNNDILIRKILIEDKKYVEIKNDEYVICYSHGKICDVEDKKGLYEIVNGNENNSSDKDLSSWDFMIQKAEEEEDGILFVNVSEIKNNKFYIRNPITYTDWTYDDEPFESKVKLEGVFNFKIIKPENFMKIVIGLRDHYSKPELLEQIRIYILKSIEEGIKELSEVHKVDISTFVNKIHELKIKVAQNSYDDKLLSKGIKITFFDIDKIDLDDETAKMLEIDEKYKNTNTNLV